MDLGDLDEVSAKIDRIHRVVQSIAAGDAQAMQEAEAICAEVYVCMCFFLCCLSRLENGWQESKDKIKSERTIINKEPPALSAEQQTLLALQQDAEERHQRRIQRDKEADALKLKGNEAFKQEAYAEAIDWYTRALTLAPDIVVIRSNRAQAYLCHGLPDKALEDCQFLVNLNRGNSAYTLPSKVWLRMGLAQRALGEYSAAIASLRKGLAASTPADRATFESEIASCESAQALAEADAHAVAGPATKHTAAIDAFLQLVMQADNSTSQELTSALSSTRSCLEDSHDRAYFRAKGGLRLLAGPTMAPFCTQQGELADGIVNEALALLAAAATNQPHSALALANDISLFSFLHAWIIAPDGGRCYPSLNLLNIVLETPAARLAVARHHPEIADELLQMADTNAAARQACTALTAEPATRERFAATPGVIAPLLSAPKKIIRLCPLLTNLAAHPVLRAEMLQSHTDLLLHTAAATTNDESRAALLGLYTNLSVEPDFAKRLQTASVLAMLLPLLSRDSEDTLPTHRAASLLARLCSDAAFACMAVQAGTVPLLLTVCKGDLGEESPAEPAMRALAKICMHSGVEAREQVMGAGDVVLRLIDKGSEGMAGNAALCLGECAREPKLCGLPPLAPAVPLLLVHAKKERCTLQENSAIAIARLCQNNTAHLAALRALGGLEVLHSRLR
eukprot:m.126278 g.126278  ORF g.126278 m.126278 type:complete len:682 (+) comp14688_c0_seq6:1221-3266(+)